MAEKWVIEDEPATPGKWVIEDSQPAAVSTGKWINRAVKDVIRAPGLTARYGLEGLAQIAQVGTEPIRYFQDLITPSRGDAPKSLPLGMVATKFADKIGLPKPENANERVVGDATRLVAGGGALAGAAKAGAVLPGMTGKAMEFLAANLPQQLGSAAGAGLAGGASREGGGSAALQGTSALLGGVVGGLAPGAVTGTVSAVRNALAPKLTNQQIDIHLTSVLNRAGADFGDLPNNAKNALRNELRDALQANRELDPVAVRRLADFATVRGATPTRGMVTQNPVQITREMNLAKTGANSGDNQLHGMAQIQNQNNRVLIDNLNSAGAVNGSVDDAGRLVTSTVSGKAAGLRSAEDAAWSTARNSPGYKQPISSGVLSDINRALDEEGLMPFMSKEISNYMAAFQTGQRPFTPQDYRNLQSMLAREAKAGGNSGYAAGAAQRVLQNAQPTPIQPSGPALTTAATAATMQADDAASTAARNSLDAVNQARGATRAAYQYEDSSPLVRSVLSDGATSDPQRIAQRYVIGSTTDEARILAKEVGPQGMGTIKNALLAHLKSKALNESSDELGSFSQSAFNKELNKIGVEKLRIFFSPEEVTHLQALGRVAGYMQKQPVGTAVNNSNSGALLLGRGVDMLNKIPVVGPMVGPSMSNINASMQLRAAQNLKPGLLVEQPGRQLAAPLLLPALAFSGGLLSQ